MDQASRKKNRKQIKVTLLADAHAERVVEYLRTLGQAASKTSVVSEAILAIQLPPQTGEQIKLTRGLS